MTKEDEPKIRFAIEIILDAQGLSDGGIAVNSAVIASDEEMCDRLVEVLKEDGPIHEYTPEESRAFQRRRQFSFSSSTWHATWEPKGPTAPWRNEEGPIN